MHDVSLRNKIGMLHNCVCSWNNEASHLQTDAATNLWSNSTEKRFFIHRL